MGQYWMPVNIDKREYVNPHKLATGLKLWEQLANHPGTGAALIVLTAAMPEARGGGDFDLETNWHGPEREDMTKPGEMPEEYPAVAARTIGRWAGDRICLVGDYAEPEDMPSVPGFERIYSRCMSEEDWQTYCANDKQNTLALEELYTDVAADVAAVIEHELQGCYWGTGWCNWTEGVSRELVERFDATQVDVDILRKMLTAKLTLKLHEQAKNIEMCTQYALKAMALRELSINELRALIPEAEAV